MRELQRAFKKTSAAPHLRETLKEIAEPVRATATGLALSSIPRMTLPWAQFRIGVTAHSVYIAPKKRGTRFPERKRPNFGTLLLGRSMIPAAEQNVAELNQGIREMGDRIERAFDG